MIRIGKIVVYRDVTCAGKTLKSPCGWAGAHVGPGAEQGAETSNNEYKKKL